MNIKSIKTINILLQISEHLLKLTTFTPTNVTTLKSIPH